MTPFGADALLRKARKTLLDAGIETASDDALLLFQHATGLDRLTLLKAPNHEISPAVCQQLADMLEARIQGKPVGRIIGKRVIFDLDLALNTATLEPREDTYALIEAVIPHVERIAQKKGRCHLLDIGTGTGLIALSILKACETALVTATDISEKALFMAVENAKANGLQKSASLGRRFKTLLSDGFGNVEGRFDLIVSNPPYIKSIVIDDLSTEVKDHDPLIALDGGWDGLDFYRMIAEKARSYLANGGIVAVEIGYDQKSDVIALFESNGWALVSAHKDLSGNDRALIFS